jgi:hypothetical protein
MALLIAFLILSAFAAAAESFHFPLKLALSDAPPKYQTTLDAVNYETNVTFGN